MSSARVWSRPILLTALVSVFVGALTHEANAARCSVYRSMPACENGGPEYRGDQCYACTWNEKGPCQRGEETDCINKQLLSEIQTLLNKKGYSVSTSGKFDAATKNAVIEFQKSMKLKPDGKVGEKTLERLRN